ncbi:MAG: aminoacyl-tRNA hydrolase [Candidatus Babeliaceae bacterium]|jgi:PTH1 family peptidyl-tRNA hydrolase
MIKIIIGLGNPGQKYSYTRHNIGFLVVDQLVDMHNGSWKSKNDAEIAEITINNKPILVIKPQTFMNNSGAIMPSLQKKGIKPEEILVVHDELELPFGKVAIKQGGSAKGHNGLKSIISYIGDAFSRLRCGIGRPEQREDVADYVLNNFLPTEDVQSMIVDAIKKIDTVLQ